jgi:hypothetical protein
MWLTCRLIPDHKTIADFRKDSGPAIKQVCVQFIELCRQMGLLATASIFLNPVDGTPGPEPANGIALLAVGPVACEALMRCGLGWTVPRACTH